MKDKAKAEHEMIKKEDSAALEPPTGALESLEEASAEISRGETEEISKEAGTGSAKVVIKSREEAESEQTVFSPAHAVDHTQVLTGLSHVERTYLLSLAGLSTLVRSTGRLFWTNFLMGMARGIGFVIGMSIIGALVVGIWDEFVSVTGIGRFIARILEEVSRNAPK